MSDQVRVSLKEVEGYRFENMFAGGGAPLVTDEPPPLGEGAGPSPSQLLTAAVANCLCASLRFALQKFHQDASPLTAEATATIERNAHQRLRVSRIEVVLQLGRPASEIAHLDRILASFEDYCTVSQSVAQGLPVLTSVVDIHGVRCK